MCRDVNEASSGGERLERLLRGARPRQLDDGGARADERLDLPHLLAGSRERPETHRTKPLAPSGQASIEGRLGRCAACDRAATRGHELRIQIRFTQDECAASRVTLLRMTLDVPLCRE